MLSDRCPVCPVLSVCNVGALWPNGWMDQDKTWHAGRPRPWSHCVIDGDPALPPQRGIAPQFSAHICWGQMAGSIKMPLSMIELGLCVRWGPSPSPKFSAHVYYSYCAFVRTLHSRYWFVQVQVQVLVLYAFYFLKNTEANGLRTAETRFGPFASVFILEQAECD